MSVSELYPHECAWVSAAGLSCVLTHDIMSGANYIIYNYLL